MMQRALAGQARATVEVHMRFDSSPTGILLLVAIVLFVLAAIGVNVGDIALLPLGLAAFAAAFLFKG